MSKLLSIIIPSYNTSKYIDQTIPTMLDDSINDLIEILIISDGSNDDTVEKANLYAVKFPNTIRIIDKTNGGHGSVINRGIEEAKGKYIKVIDGDDYVDTSEFVRFVNEIFNVDFDMCVSDYSTVSAVTGEVKRKSVFNNAIKKNKHIKKCKVYPAEDVLLNITGTIHNITYKTEMLRSNKPIVMSEKTFYEDNEYDLFPIPYVKTVFISDCNVYRYLIDQANQSVSKNNLIKRLPQQHRIAESLIDYYNKYVNVEEMSAVKKKYFCFHASRMMVGIIKIYMLIEDKPEKVVTELIEFERRVKEFSEDIYRQAWHNKLVRILRMSNYLLYPMLRKRYK